MKKSIIILTFIFVWCQQSWSQQDVHYSQFFNAPLIYNPGTTGVIDGDFRTYFNFRSQWASIVTSPYVSKSFSIDAPMIGESDEGSFFGIGINIHDDIAGDSQLKSTNYGLSVNYCLELDRSSYLGFGIKGGLLQRKINYNDLLWSNQFVVDHFDVTRESGETTAKDAASAIDLGSGIYYYNKINQEFRLFGGVAAEHLNAPNISFLGATERYLRKYYGHMGAEIRKKNTNLSYLPNLMLMWQGNNRYLNVGTEVKFVLNSGSRMTGYYKEIFMAGGLFYRWGDAAYVTARFKYDEFGFGASYDLNVSSLSANAGSAGAFEFMFTYQPAFTDRAKLKQMFD